MTPVMIIAMNECVGSRPGRNHRVSSIAFTLIEIIGVVAVIAILASVLVPRVVSVISRGKVSATAQSLGGLRGVVTEYLVRSNTLPSRLGSSVTNAAVAGGRFDADLLQAGLVDRLFACSIGSQVSQGGNFGCSASQASMTSLLERAHLRSMPGGAGSLVPVTNSATQVNFDLSRDGTGELTASQMVAYAYIPGVRAVEAVELNKAIDGDITTAGAADLAGRCINSAMSSDNTVTLYVYLGHR